MMELSVGSLLHKVNDGGIYWARGHALPTAELFERPSIAFRAQTHVAGLTREMAL